MEGDKFSRNRTPEKGSENDPGLRDNTGQQPGTSTISTGKADEHNEKLTEISRQGENPKDHQADRVFDEGEE